MKKLLVICGPSGSGKSHLEDELCEHFPKSYKSLLQYTTRPRREGDKLESYLFLNRVEDVDLLKTNGVRIVGETEIMGNYYGTFLNDEVDDSVVQTVVLNRMGIDNLLTSHLIQDYQIKILKVLASPNVTIPERAGRSQDYIRQEIESLQGLNSVTLVRDEEGFDYNRIHNLITNLFTA